ncbi:ribonuclease HII [Candidatus Endowatersipora endosymbiont of Watersipora subatra]|uniref:ribonuclease HII n=1 Tax=Candidatus Endowatersipora endosymbiont of Watersipora subatra TaxID=3077946 RepID=UPI00312C94D4
MSSPDFYFEKKIINKGKSPVCGVDEAGRGSLAGPVVSAAVILNPTNIPEGLNDSKKLCPRRRENLYQAIMDTALSISVSSLSSRTIDTINIHSASLITIANAVKSLALRPEYALIDGNSVPHDLVCESTVLIKGDAKSLSISAASIIAKVTRDQLMIAVGKLYPDYLFHKNKGYGTKEHLKRLKEKGPCPIHRYSFIPIMKAIQSCSLV